MKKEWFVIHAYSGYENKVQKDILRRAKSMNMEDKIFRVEVPEEFEVQIKDGKKRTIKRKIYPGYVMVEMELTDDSWYVVRNTTGVTGFVGTGAKPIPLDDHEVEMIMRQMSVEEPNLALEYSVGETVRITEGPFEGVEGEVMEINEEKSKVRVQVTMVSGAATVEMDYLQVEKVDVL